MTRLSANILAVAALLAPALASAQAAAPAGAAPTPGAPIVGMCFFSQNGALATSKAGQALGTRLRQLGSQVQAELAPQEQALQSEDKAIAALPANQREQRAQALQQRANTLQQTAQMRQAQLQLTQNRAAGQVAAQMTPIVQSLAASRRCAVVFDASVTFGYNPAMDLTRDTVTQLDQKMPTLSFDLATPEQVRQAAQTQGQR